MSSDSGDITSVAGVLESGAHRPQPSAVGSVSATNYYTIIPAHTSPNSIIDIEIHVTPTAAATTPSIFKLVSAADGSGAHALNRTKYAFTLVGTSLPTFQLVAEAGGVSLTGLFSANAEIAVFSLSTRATPGKYAPVVIASAGGWPAGTAVFDTSAGTGNMTSQVSPVGGGGGPAIPAGGVYSQVLTKNSATDGDVAWNLYWDDVTVPLSSGTAVAGDSPPPMTPFIGNLQLPLFNGSTVTPDTQSLHFTLQMPHGWAAGTEIRPHIHIANGSTDPLNAFGAINVTHATNTTYPGLYVYAGAPGWVDGSGTTRLVTTGGKSYAYYYNATKNTTLMYSSNGSIFRLLNGDYRAAGPHPAPGSAPLTSNVGTLSGGIYYPSVGTFTGYTIGMLHTGGAGTPYAYASIPITAGPAGTAGTYTYVCQAIYADGATLLTVTPDLVAPFYNAYYCPETDLTLIYMSAPVNAYVLAVGNFAAANRPVSAWIVLTGNTGANDAGAPDHYFPAPAGTWNGITLGAYSAVLLSKIRLQYSWANIGDPFPAATIIAASFVPTASIYDHEMVQLSHVVGTGKKLSSMIVGRVSRVPSDPVDTAGFAWYGVSFDFHAQFQGIGYGPGPGDGAV